MHVRRELPRSARLGVIPKTIVVDGVEIARQGYEPPLGIPPQRRKVCASNLSVPHGVGHNATCVCGCRWCREERGESKPTAPAPVPVLVQGDLFAGSP